MFLKFPKRTKILNYEVSVIKGSRRRRIRAIGELAAKAPAPKIIPLKPMPIQTLVVNVTNQCNLSCEYCYEYGEDKIVDTENGSQPKFMSAETARATGSPPLLPTAWRTSIIATRWSADAQRMQRSARAGGWRWWSLRMRAPS